MDAISLCSGIGGIDIGMSFNGFNVIAQVEINPFCQKVLKHHASEYWSDSTIFSDVRTFGKESVKSKEIALVAGGFPCQPFSIAGARKGADDSRNLWGQFRRIIGEFKPRAVLLENVPGICNPYKVSKRTGAQGAKIFIRKRSYSRPAYALKVVKDLTQMGYKSKWGVISAFETGAMHERKRWYLIAYREVSDSHEIGRGRGRDNREKRHFPPHKGLTAKNQQIGERRLGRIGAIGTINGHEMVNAPSAGLAEFGGGKPKVAKSSLSVERQKGLLLKSLMGNTPNGLPDWMVRRKRVAGPDQQPHDWEPSRTLDYRGEDYTPKIEALGNSVFVPVLYSLCLGIRCKLLHPDLFKD